MYRYVVLEAFFRLPFFLTPLLIASRLPSYFYCSVTAEFDSFYVSPQWKRTKTGTCTPCVCLVDPNRFGRKALEFPQLVSTRQTTVIHQQTKSAPFCCRFLGQLTHLLCHRDNLFSVRVVCACSRSNTTVWLLFVYSIESICSDFFFFFFSRGIPKMVLKPHYQACIEWWPHI